jgi:mono/diheme cytochrome c family protein
MTDLLLLATEVAETAEQTGEGAANIAVTILLVALGAFAVAFFLVGPGKKAKGDKRKGDVPLAMRPYHSDAELETTGLERAMAWGVALAMFSGVFLAVYWIIEPDRINDKVDEFYDTNAEIGRLEFNGACASCHGENAQGGFAPHPDPAIDAPWPAPTLNNIAARYEDSALLKTTTIRDFMVQTLMRGRPGTPMPAWSTAFSGAMNDAQIESIVDYLLSIQTGIVPEAQAFVGAAGSDLFQNNCARCHGADALGGIGPNLTIAFSRYGASADDPVATAEAIKAIKHTLINGRYVPAAVPMPAWGDVLSDDALDRIVEYLLAIQNPPVR